MEHEPTPEDPKQNDFEDLATFLAEVASEDHGRTRDVAAHRETYDPLWQLAMEDPQTGLVNELVLRDRCGQEIARRRRHGGVVVGCNVSLDNLKEINGRFGARAGTTALKETAQRLTSVVRSQDTVSRVGPRSFAVLMTVDNERTKAIVRRRLQGALRAPVALGDTEMAIAVTVTDVRIEDDGRGYDVLRGM
jgi:diguanylate cyclase (GGDEF)-like protein